MGRPQKADRVVWPREPLAQGEGQAVWGGWGGGLPWQTRRWSDPNPNPNCLGRPGGGLTLTLTLIALADPEVAGAPHSMREEGELGRSETFEIDLEGEKT